MRPVECAREEEVLDALATGGPLESWSPDLRSHTVSCAVCHDISVVAGALLDEHRATVELAQPPTSAIVWWRAQMRARQEAAQAATRPITVVQALAFASGAAIFTMLLVFAAPTMTGWFGGLSVFSDLSAPTLTFQRPEIDVASLMSSTYVGIVGLGALALLLLGPVAVYFALGDE